MWEGEDLCGLLPFGGPASYTFLSHPVPHPPRLASSWSAAQPPSPMPTIVHTTAHLLWLFKPRHNNCVVRSKSRNCHRDSLSACFTFQAWQGMTRSWGDAQCALGSVTALVRESLGAPGPPWGVFVKRLDRMFL